VTIFQGFIAKLGMKQLAKELLGDTNSKKQFLKSFGPYALASLKPRASSLSVLSP
jgi:hypothetical protein